MKTSARLLFVCVLTAATCLQAGAGQVVPERDRTAKLADIARLMDRENPDVAALLDGGRDPFFVDDTPVVSVEETEAKAAEETQSNNRAVLRLASSQFMVRGVLTGAGRVFLVCADGRNLVVGDTYSVEHDGSAYDVAIESAGAESYVISVGGESVEVPFVETSAGGPAK